MTLTEAELKVKVFRVQLKGPEALAAVRSVCVRCVQCVCRECVSEMDASLLVEALSTLMGRQVKPHSGPSGIELGELTVENFISSAFLPRILCRDEPSSGPQSSTGTPQELSINLQNFYAPSFNYDFRKFTESAPCSRAGEPYTRPAGWFRFALNVLNKYEGGNGWLGSKGWRNHSEADEWPVSYHGTGHAGTGTEDAGAQQEFGIYSVPDVQIAERDGMLHKEFTSKDGKTYRVVMQNRINPKFRVKKSDELWFVQIPMDVFALREEEQKKRIRQIVDEAIRPYGILVKEFT